MPKTDQLTDDCKCIRELLDYDPETGEFVWKISPSKNVAAGTIAGYVGTDGYRRIKIDGALLMAHRLAWLYVHGAWPKDQIDHISGARGENRIANLREASCSENQQNRPINRNNKSGHPGVSWCTARRKWVAFIRVNKKQINLGRFRRIEDAGAAYRAAKAHMHPFHPETRGETPPPSP